MSEERDRELLRHYRAASGEMPPPALGRALRAAAAEAVATPPLRWQRKWGAPLAMAASVVLGLGVVLRVALERPDLQPVPASAPVSAPAAAPPAPVVAGRSEPVAAPSSAPAAAPRPDTATSAVEREATQQPVIAEKKLSPQPRSQASNPEAKPQKSADMAAVTEAAPARDLARAELPMRAPSIASAPAAGASAPAPENARAQAPPLGETTASQAAGATAKAAESAMQEPRPAPAMAPAARAKALGAGAAQSADSAELGVVVEAELAPDDWLRRIVVLRRAARHAEADASLARFVRRYPDHRIPQQARAPQP